MKDLSYWKARHVCVQSAANRAYRRFKAGVIHKIHPDELLIRAGYYLDLEEATKFAQDKIEAIESQILVNKL